LNYNNGKLLPTDGQDGAHANERFSINTIRPGTLFFYRGAFPTESDPASQATDFGFAPDHTPTPLALAWFPTIGNGNCSIDSLYNSLDPSYYTTIQHDVKGRFDILTQPASNMENAQAISQDRRRQLHKFALEHRDLLRHLIQETSVDQFITDLGNDGTYMSKCSCRTSPDIADCNAHNADRYYHSVCVGYS
jgi:hypothetical protein